MANGMGYGLGIVKGMGVTMRNFFRKPVTVQYPEERNPQASRFRGQEFTWYVERCTGCASCAKYCPLGIIQIVTSPSGELKQEGDGYKLEKFSIEVSRCMFCGLCVEACPYDALHMGSGFQQGNFVQKDTWIHIDELKHAEKRPSTWFKPHLEEKKYNPMDGKPLPWHEAGREGWRWHQKEKAGGAQVQSTLGPYAVAEEGKGARTADAGTSAPFMDEKQPEVRKTSDEAEGRGA